MVIVTRKLTSKFAPLILAVLVAGTEARGDITITIEQSGNNVVENGSGTVTTSGLTGYGSGPLGYEPQLDPQYAFAIVGAAYATDDVYRISGPASFGTSGPGVFTSGSGSTFGIINAGGGEFALPSDYVSGATLSGSATFDNTNFTNLGLTAGTSYIYTFGTDQYLTVQILSTATAVPEPSTAIVAVFGAIAFIAHGWSRHRRAQRRQAAA